MLILIIGIFKMIEMMLGNSNTKTPLKYLVDISFDSLSLGSKSIVDNGTAGLIYTMTGAGTNAGVINDPEYGRCFAFDGNLYFTATNFATKIGKFSNRKIQIEVAFKKTTNATGNLTVFSTGDYQSYQYAGMRLYTTGASSNYVAMFLENGGVYAFNYTTMSWTNNWEPLVINRAASGGGPTTILNTRLNQTWSFNAFDTGSDSWFKIGFAEPGATGTFIGYLKYLRIADLNAQ